MATDSRLLQMRSEAADAFVYGGLNQPRGVEDKGCCSQPEPARCQVICVASGKGGTGKSFVSANLAVELAKNGHRVALIDADFGLANAHLMLGLQPRHDISHLMSGERTVEQLIEHGPMGVRLIPGGSNRSALALAADADIDLIVSRLAPIEEHADIVLVDLAAGISRRTARFLSAAHDIVLVANHEITSRSDVMSTLGMLADTLGAATVHLVINMARDRSHATVTFQQIWTAANRQWRGRIKLFFSGWIPRNHYVQSSIMRGRPIVIAHPNCSVTQCIRNMALRMIKHHRVWRSRQIGRWSQPSAFSPIAGPAAHPALTV